MMKSSFKLIFSLCAALSVTFAPLSSSAEEAATAPQAVEVAKANSNESATGSAWNDFSSAFAAGVSAYQSGKFAEALPAFQRALSLSPDNVSALTNLGLTEFQLGNKPAALAWLRRANHLDPYFSTPTAAIAFIQPQLTVKEIPHEISTWEIFRTNVLQSLTTSGVFLFLAFSLLGLGWLILRYLGQRKRALEQQTALPVFTWPLALCGVLFVLSLGLSFSKIYDDQIARGTIVVEKTPVRSAPSEQGPALFDLYGGLEVILQRQEKDWIQVTYPGALSGWIPASSVVQTAGKSF